MLIHSLFFSINIHHSNLSTSWLKFLDFPFLLMGDIGNMMLVGLFHDAVNTIVEEVVWILSTLYGLLKLICLSVPERCLFSGQFFWSDGMGRWTTKKILIFGVFHNVGLLSLNLMVENKMNFMLLNLNVFGC